MPSFLMSKNKSDCCGCGSCRNACPVNCITMESDAEGYWYPVIQEDRCVHCQCCHLACGWTEEAFHLTDCNLPDSYAAWHQDQEIREQSTSGGAFSALATVIINKGGRVYGARFAEDFSVMHCGAETKEECRLFCGSKYVQSQLGNCYQEIKDRLAQEQYVLFTGTPCQVGALYAFLGRDDAKLVTAEIVCHGISSPRLWQDYLRYLQDKFHSKITHINFRDKSKGWGIYLLRMVFQNGAVYCKKAISDFFYRTFLTYYLVRPSCYQCRYKKTPREADLSLADFWGIEELQPSWDTNKGVSLILGNTAKGHKLLTESQTECFLYRVPFSQIPQDNLYKNYPYAHQRDTFFQTYRDRGVAELLFSYVTFPLIMNLPERGWKYLRRSIKRIFQS